MAEQQVDEIVIPILLEIGCSFAEEVKTIAGFTSDQFVQAASRMVMRIKPEQPLPYKMPKSKAARFRVCTAVANAVTDLGYQGELGYEKFLYPNDKDIRAVLIWLMNKLPKSDAGNEEDEADTDSSAAIAAAMRAWYNEKYNPYLAQHHHRAHGLTTTKLMTPGKGGDDVGTLSAFEETYYKEYQPGVSNQPRRHEQLAPSVMELNTKELCLAQERQAAFDAGEKSSQEKRDLINSMMAEAFSTERRMAEQRGKKLQDVMADIAKAYGSGSAENQNAESQFSRKVAFEEEVDESAQVVKDGAVKQVTEKGEEVKEEDEDAIRERQDKRLSELQAEIKAVQAQLDKIKLKMDEFDSTARQLDGDVRGNEKEVKELMDKYKLKQKTLKLLPEAEKNLEKLEKICSDSEERIKKLGELWEKHRVPQIEKFRRQKQLLNDRKNEVRKKVDAIRRMRTEMKQMVQDIRRKDEIYKQLVEELNKMPKSINRQVYIRRIMDIMKNLDKQKVQIKHILNDVRTVQRDINNVSDTSSRSFETTEKVVYDAAKSSDKSSASAGLQAYENLAKLRDGFDQLVKTVEETGRTKNEIRAYETQIEALEAQNTGLNMQRVADDLKQIKAENKTLTSKLRKLKGAGS